MNGSTKRLTLVTVYHDGFDHDEDSPDANANGKIATAGIYNWFGDGSEVEDREFAPDETQAEERATDLVRKSPGYFLMDDLTMPDYVEFETAALVVKSLVENGYIEALDAHVALAAVLQDHVFLPTLPEGIDLERLEAS